MNPEVLQKVNSPKRIAVVGPECTGKSTLSQQLAKHYQTDWVPEYARGYLEKLPIPYVQNDLLRIAQGQMRIEDEFARDANRVLLCDTNLLVIKIWSEFKYQTCNDWILEEIAKRNYALHLLTYIDVPWSDDPQREHPTKREELYTLYKQELEAMKVPFIEIRGTHEARVQSAIAAIDKLLLDA